MSIFEFYEARAGDGLGLALLDEDDVVATPYVDPSDYPDTQVDTRGYSGCGRYWLCAHVGILETNPNFFKNEHT